MEKYNPLTTNPVIQDENPDTSHQLECGSNNDTFIDLCKSSIGTEIGKDYIILPRIEFRKLKNKIDEFSKLVTINQN